LTTTKITLADYLIPTKLTTSETVDNQTVIIHLGAGTYFTLNNTGSYLWGRLDGETSLSVIALELSSIHSIDAATVKNDVLALARELFAEGLVERV
jgi:hypothetical protein